MKNKIILVAFFTIIGVILFINHPFDTDGVIRATIESTVAPSQGQPIIVSINVIGPRNDMFIHGSVVQFLDESEIREMAELQGSVLYHEFKKFDFEIFGYSVAIDHLTMYPSNSTQICYSCYGDLGIVSYRNNKWSYEETGSWVS